MKKTARILLYVCCILLLSASCSIKGQIRLSDFSHSQAALKDSIKILVWNVYKGKNGKKQIRKDFVHIIHQKNPDLLFIQEGKSDLFSIDGMGADFATSFKWPVFGSPNGVITFSKTEPIMAHGETSNWRESLLILPIITPKASLITEYVFKNGKTLLAINVHCLNYERWTTFGLKSQLNELKGYMIRHDGPIIFVGDFNTWNEKRLNVVKSIVDEVGLKEVTQFPEGRSTGDTGSRVINFLYSINASLPLDRVYYRGLELQHAEIFTQYTSSDHIPLYVEFIVP